MEIATEPPQKKQNLEPPNDQAQSHLGTRTRIPSQRQLQHIRVCCRLHTAAKLHNTPWCPPTEMNKEPWLAFQLCRRMKCVIHVNWPIMTLGGLSQSQKDEYPMFSLICRYWMLHRYIKSRRRHKNWSKIVQENRVLKDRRGGKGHGHRDNALKVHGITDWKCP